MTVAEREAGHLADVLFRVTDLEVVSGDGAIVTTSDGERYLDFTSGIAVTSTGHSHPAVVRAIQEQAARIIHAQGNVFRSPLREELATALARITPAAIDSFVFANSGAEATEAAVKLAKHVTGRTNVIVFEGSFHGRTHLAMAMTTSKTSYRAGYAPLPSGVFVAPFASRDADADLALARFDHLLASQTAPSETAAIVIEPVLGEGGYVPASPRFLQGLRERCTAHGILFVADEVQTGFGRTGRMFAVDHHGVDPDIIVLAKGLASGFPISAVGARRALMEAWPVGAHGGTYGGNPLGCAAALATIGVLTEPGFLDAVAARGVQLRTAMDRLAADHECITEVRGLGLMIGVVFDEPDRVQRVIAHCLGEGRLVLMSAGTRSDVVRWMPPLVVNPEQIDQAVAAFGAAVAAA